MTLKHLMAMLGITLTLGGCAGMEPIPEADKTFDRVIEAPGYTKDQIYSQTKIWIAENFKSAKSVIELDSRDDGVIIGNGIMPYPCNVGCTGWKVPFQMRVDIKDQKFKLSFSQITLVIPGTMNGFPPPRAFVEIKPALLAYGDRILASMHKSSNKSEW